MPITTIVNITTLVNYTTTCLALCHECVIIVTLHTIITAVLGSFKQNDISQGFDFK
jgi:hypothetical protein